MDQLAVLEKLEKVAAVMRRGGMHRLTRLGRNIAKRVLINDLAIQIDDLSMCAPMGLRGFLYRARSGSMEPYMSRLFTEAVRPSSVVLDVGACLGYYTLLAAKRGAKVYAFEPDESVFKFLLANVRENKFNDRVIAMPKAVSNSTGVKTLFINESPDLNSFFVNTGEVKETVDVHTTSIDEFLDDTVNVDIVKIDVEGAELQVLAGMERTLARSKEATMFVESNPHCLRSAGYSPETLVARIEDLGFRVMVIDERNAQLRSVLDTKALTRTVNLYCSRFTREE